jgi:transposase, IS5 family
MEHKGNNCSILRSLNLDNIEEVISEAYHKQGAGRPPRKPIGIFKARIMKSVQQIPSDRELYRRLDKDQDLRELCDLADGQKPYHPSQLTRFRDRIGSQSLQKIMDTLINELSDSRIISGKKVVLDATFIKAHSKRALADNSKGAADPDARVGRNGKTYNLGDKLHLAIDAESERPLAAIIAPANDNDKKHAPMLVE